MRLTTYQFNTQMGTQSILRASILTTVTTGDTRNSKKYTQFKSMYVEAVRYVEAGGPLYERPCTAKPVSINTRRGPSSLYVMPVYVGLWFLGTLTGMTK